MHVDTVLARVTANHNETLVADRTSQSQTESADAGLAQNHNETLVSDQAA